jgi:hypothetical protein
MINESRGKSISAGELRNFGLMMAVMISAVFGLLLPWVFAMVVPLWPWGVSGLFLFWSLIHPASLRLVYDLWMKLAVVLSWINTRIILGLAFFIIFVPLGLMMRVFANDPMRRKTTDAPSYRVEAAENSKNDIERPF